MTAVLFGSIGTLADTSELQRESFNEAFAEHGLDWNWSRDAYRKLLADSGGTQRIADFAASLGVTVDAAAIHRTKSELFRRRLKSGGVQPRPGVVDTIAAAEHEGYRVALVTTTSPENVTAITEALSSHIDPARFTLLVDTSQVEHPKPAPDAYRFALARLGEPADACVAIEDNVGGVKAASQAGVAVLAFPGANNADHDFDEADGRTDKLDFAELRSLAGAA
jgi:HAD superfamily hydrolase (TIGR01509 family)